MESISSTKEKIIDTAIALFAKNGYGETSIREIANEVGIRSSSIYNHFKTKEAIMDEILTQYKRQTFYMDMPKINWGNYGKLSLEEIRDILFFTFPEGSADRYRSILKIVLFEHKRNDNIQKFLVNDVIAFNFNTLKANLDQMQEHSLIPPCDSAAVTALFSSVLLAYTLLSTMDMQNLPVGGDDIGMFRMLEYIIGQLMDGSLQ